jgi:hypothetical protein
MLENYDPKLDGMIFHAVDKGAAQFSYLNLAYNYG